MGSFRSSLYSVAHSDGPGAGAPSSQVGDRSRSTRPGSIRVASCGLVVALIVAVFGPRTKGLVLS